MSTIAEKLQLTLNSKNEIKKVMQNKFGLDVTDDTPLAEYAGKLESANISTKIPAFVISAYVAGSSGPLTMHINNISGQGYSILVPTSERNCKIKAYTSLTSELAFDKYDPYCGENAEVTYSYTNNSNTNVSGTTKLTNSNEFILSDVDFSKTIDLTPQCSTSSISQLKIVRVDLESTSEEATEATV
jgi:hypothetical protein